MKVGSLFSGIGGMDLGLERAGMRVVWQCEIDPYCRKVLAKHWPDVPKYGDIRAIDWDLVEPVDLLCGGFPCQDISLAGKQAGIEGERSGLWKEFHRAICELRPAVVLVENVSALRGNGIDVVLGDLAESGYDAEWDCIPACAVGAPHRRDRIWIVAYPQGSRLEGPGDVQSADRCRPETRLFGRGGENVPDTDSESLGRPSEPRSQCGHWLVEPNVGRVAHGVPKRLDRLKGLGNAVVPQVVEWLGRRIIG